MDPSSIKQSQSLPTSSSTDRPNSLPPVYTPRATYSLTPPNVLPAAPACQATLSDDAFSPPINLTVRTPVKILGHANTISLCPSKTVGSNMEASVANSLLNTLLKDSTILMDEDGRARPLNITIDASFTLIGSRNIIGQEAVAARTAAASAAILATAGRGLNAAPAIGQRHREVRPDLSRPTESGSDLNENRAVSGISRKRRAGSEPAGIPGLKRSDI